MSMVLHNPNGKCKTNKKTDTQPAIQERTLRGMRRDYRRSLKGGEDKKKAAACNNVINYPLFKVPLCHVCPPYLHIALGVVKKHHDMLENECHKDKDIATYLAQTNQPVDKNTHFGKHVTKLRKEKRNKSKPAGELKNGTGPVASNLDAVLNKHRIVRKAYHGRSFVGNHCNNKKISSLRCLAT